MSSISLPDKSQIASFDVDPQNTFTPNCGDELPVTGALDIVPELNRQATFAAFRLASKDAHSPHALWIADEKHPPLSEIKGENMDVRWPMHAVPGTLGFDLIEGLPKVSEYDYFIWKGIELDMHPYGACYHDFAEKLSTGAIEFLKQKNVSTVLVGGLATDYCVKATVGQLLNAEFRVIVNLSACRGVSIETTNAAIKWMAECGAEFIDSTQLLPSVG